MQLTVEAV